MPSMLMHTNGLTHLKRKNDENGGEITCICMYLQCNSLSPGLVQHKVRNDSPLAFLLPLSVQDVEIKWGLREIFFCSLQTHVGRIQDDTACYAYVLYVQAHSHYTYMRFSRKPPRSRKKKFRLAAFMQVVTLSLLSKYAGDPFPRVPALPACIIITPSFIFSRKSTQAQRKKNPHSLK